MADDSVLNDPRVSVDGSGAAPAGPRIEVRPKSAEDTTLQSLPTDAGTGGAAASPAGSSTGAQEAPVPVPPPADTEAEAAGIPSPASGHDSGLPSEYPGYTAEPHPDGPSGTLPETYPGFEPLNPDAESLAGTFASQAAASAVEGTPVAAGMMAGAAIGGAVGGPFAPVTAVAGALLGAGAGSIAAEPLGRVYRNLLSVPRVEDLPDNLKTFGYGGQFFGSVIPMAAAPLTAARTGFRFASDRVGNYLNKVLDYARDTTPANFAPQGLSGPASSQLHGVVGTVVKAARGVAAHITSRDTSGAARMAAHELAGAVGGTAGTMTARAALPHNETAALVGGVVGGFLSPTRLVQTIAVDPAMHLIRRGILQFSEAARQTAAAKILSEAVSLAGDDPSTLVAILRASRHPALTDVTSAQITGSQALADIEAKLASKNPVFKAQAGRLAADAYAAIRDTIALLKSTGDPAALQTVARLRDTYFHALIANRIKEAEAIAEASARAVTQDTPATRAELSKAVSAAVEKALEDARAAEKYMWEQIPSKTPSAADNLIAAIAEIKSKDILANFGEKLPAIIENIETALTNPLKSGNLRGMTSGELLLLRSNMLSKAKSAAAKGDFNDARIYGKIAEAALDDLGEISGDVKDKVDAARGFSRQLHDTFTRTFAGDTAAVNAKGADRIPAELVLQRALGSGAEGGDLRLSQLADATDFMAKKGWDAGAPEEVFGAVGTIRESVDRLVRLAAADSIEPISGRIQASKLARFISAHDAILNRFPEVRAALTRAIDDVLALERMEAVAKNADPLLERATAFAKIVNVDSPGMAIRKAINGDTPASDLLAMAKLAKRGGQPAVDGMAKAGWEYAFEQAREANGAVSFAKLKQSFFDPMAPGVPSLMDTLVKAGVVSRVEANNVATLLEAAERVQAGTKGVAKGTHNEFDPLMTAVVQIAGSRLGGLASKMALGSSTLIANSAGARYLRGVFANIGVKGVQDVLMRAARDPKLMADLLERAPSQAQSLRDARYIHAYLLASGVLSLESQQNLDRPDIADGPQ